MEKIFTGAIERKKTESDVLLGSFTTTTRPEIFMPKWLGTIEHQHKIPACGSHAGQIIKQILENFRGSPEYLWKKIKLIDGFAPSEGTDMLSILKTLNKKGICSIDLMPNNSDTETLEQYTDSSTITEEMNIDALKHRVGAYAFSWNPTFEELKQAIYDHKAVIMLLRIGKEWWTRTDGVSSWAEKDILPLRTTEQIGSGHFVVAFAYGTDTIFFVNEWGNTWGMNGLGYFKQDYMPRVVEIGTTVNLEETKYVFTKVLRVGSLSKFDVKQLQMKLNSLGYILTVDGIFGKMTRQAVENFQTKHQLVPDGIVGKLTNYQLNLI